MTGLANEPGRLLGPAILKYQQLNASGAQVQLKGSCTSACVMVTGIVRNLCAWPGTVLRIHAAHVLRDTGAKSDGSTELMVSHFAPGVRAWAQSSGALKVSSSKRRRQRRWDSHLPLNNSGLKLALHDGRSAMYAPMSPKEGIPDIRRTAPKVCV